MPSIIDSLTLFKDIPRPKVKDWKKIHHANSNQKRVEVISDKNKF